MQRRVLQSRSCWATLHKSKLHFLPTGATDEHHWSGESFLAESGQRFMWGLKMFKPQEPLHILYCLESCWTASYQQLEWCHKLVSRLQHWREKLLPSSKQWLSQVLYRGQRSLDTGPNFCILARMKFLSGKVRHPEGWKSFCEKSSTLIGFWSKNLMIFFQEDGWLLSRWLSTTSFLLTFLKPDSDISNLITI